MGTNLSDKTCQNMNGNGWEFIGNLHIYSSWSAPPKHTQNIQLINQKNRLKAVIRASVWKTVAAERPLSPLFTPSAEVSAPELQVEIYCGDGAFYEDDDDI